jgi:DNA polymerase-3 subunit epsilon
VIGCITEVYSQLINPKVSIPEKITEITGITDEMVKDMPTIHEVLPEFVDFCLDYPIMGHNVLFDYSFLKTNAVRQGLRFEKKALDTLLIARKIMPDLPSRSLTSLCELLDIKREQAHRAYDDAKATYSLYLLLKDSPRAYGHNKLFEPKPIYFKPQKESPITDKQIRFLSDLCSRYECTLDKPIKSLSKSEASRQIDLNLSFHGR